MYLTQFFLPLPLLLDMMKQRYHKVFLVPELAFPPPWKEKVEPSHHGRKKRRKILKSQIYLSRNRHRALVFCPARVNCFSNLKVMRRVLNLSYFLGINSVSKSYSLVMLN